METMLQYILENCIMLITRVFVEEEAKLVIKPTFKKDHFHSQKLPVIIGRSKEQK